MRPLRVTLWCTGEESRSACIGTRLCGAAPRTRALLLSVNVQVHTARACTGGSAAVRERHTACRRVCDEACQAWWTRSKLHAFEKKTRHRHRRLSETGGAPGGGEGAGAASHLVRACCTPASGAEDGRDPAVLCCRRSVAMTVSRSKYWSVYCESARSPFFLTMVARYETARARERWR